MLNDECRVVYKLLSSLLDGKTLQEACATAGVKRPGRGGSFRLFRSGESPEPLYSVSPIILLETCDTTLNRAPFALPLRSPNSSAPAWAFSLYLKDKQHLRSALAAEEKPGAADDRLRAALEHLANETGLDFKGTDAARIGNLDFLAFPSADERERPRVDVEVISSQVGARKVAEKIRVSILPAALPPSAEVLVRCRQQVGREAALDVCRLAPGAVRTLDFDVVEPLGNTSVEVWTRGEPTMDFRLWFANRYHWVRSVHIDMGVMGLRSRIGSGLLDAFNSPRLAGRVSRLLDRTQIHYKRVTSGEALHSWEESEEQGRKIASRLFPQPSGARFFAKGWAQESRLSFLEWLLGVAKRTRSGRMVLVDPFFDTVGVELLARMEATQISYSVVTSTQVPSDDDEAGQPARAERIRTACAAFGPIWRSFRVEILDIQGISDRSKRPLHDRYVLLFDDENVLERGFHLSNSIQQATRNHPLLVTPIPEDVLQDVSEYLEGLIVDDSSMVGPFKIVQIFSSRAQTISSGSDEGSLTDPFSLDGAQEVCALVLGDDGLRSATAETLKERMAVGELTENGALRLVKRLLECDEEDFHRLWSAWGFIAASSVDATGLDDAVVGHGGSGLARLLSRELARGADFPPPVGVAGVPAQHDILVLAHHFKQPFGKALEQARSFVSRLIRTYGLRAWGLRHASALLVSLDPGALVVLVAKLVASLPPSADEVVSGPALNLIAINLEPMCKLLAVRPAADLVRALLVCESDFLRALGARAVAAHERLPAEEGIELLRSMKSDVEAIHALAEWIGDLRVAANRADGLESEDLRAQRVLVTEELIARWGRDGGAGVDLSEVFDRVGGPGRGSWTRSTVSDLLLPLVNQGVLTEKDVVDLIVTTLYERIASHFSDELPGAAKHQYYAATDGELTDVAAALLAQTDPEARSKYVQQLNDAAKAGWQILYRPFARSARYHSWAAALDGLVWATAFLGLLWLHGTDAELEATERERILKEVRENWDRLMGPRESKEYEDVTGLWALEERIRVTVLARLSSGPDP
jgi:hypothetical protein